MVEIKEIVEVVPNNAADAKLPQAQEPSDTSITNVPTAPETEKQASKSEQQVPSKEMNATSTQLESEQLEVSGTVSNPKTEIENNLETEISGDGSEPFVLISEAAVNEPQTDTCDSPDQPQQETGSATDGSVESHDVGDPGDLELIDETQKENVSENIPQPEPIAPEQGETQSNDLEESGNKVEPSSAPEAIVHYERNTMKEVSEEDDINKTEEALKSETAEGEKTTQPEIKTGDQSIEDISKKSMQLTEIQSMLEKINHDIHSINVNADPEKIEVQTKFTNDFKAIRMRNDTLRQELISIKIAQDKRRPVDTSKFTEQKIIESVKLNKLKDSTCSLQTEVDLINKARKAQEHLKKSQEERKAAAQKKVREALAAEREPVDVEEIKESIALLKCEMEKIINSPIGEIVPDDENEAVTTTESTEEAGGSKPVSKNKKAHDDMMKKYVLMTVMKNNLKQLTDKMNEIMTAEGVSSVTASDSKGGSVEAADKVTESDEFYMHDDDEGGNTSDLYEEEDNAEEGEEIKPVSALSESVAKSIATVESVIYKNKEPTQETKPSPTASATTTSGAKKTTGHAGNKSGKNKRGKKGRAPPDSVLDLLRSQQQEQQEQKKKQQQTGNKKAEDVPEEEISNIPTSKIGSYNFLLKLQREMATMQIQMSKMQDGLRAANRTLQAVLASEFADM